MSVLSIERDGAVATLTLDRPERFNAFDDALRKALFAAVCDVDADDAIRVVILRGAGRGFCAGADLSEGFHDPVSEHLERDYKPTLMAIAASPKIWIAQVHGSAAGIGAAFAMNCDLMSMAEDATIYMAFAAIALVPDGGNTKLLLESLGPRRALAAVLEGRKVPAAECVEHGLANTLHSAETLDAETRAWAQRLACGAPLAMAAAKRLIRGAATADYSRTFDMEGVEQDAMLQTEDSREGIAAFFEKRKPVFTGR